MTRTASLLAAAALLIAPAIASAQRPDAAPTPTDRGPLVNLSVTESIDSAPDMATINTGVQTRAQTAKAAMSANAVQMDKLIAALVQSGIDRKDIQTSGISLNPQYDYSNRTEQQNGPKFLGYEASNQLTVKLRTIAKAGDLVDQMVAAGATNINGPTFGIADQDKLLDQARTKALKTAQTRADLYAQATGHRSARLVGISETGGFSPPVPSWGMMRADAAQASTKIEPGQISTSLTLNVQYLLER